MRDLAMQDDDGRYLLTVALEMRLAARMGVCNESPGLSRTRMTEIAEQLERIGTLALRPAGARRRAGNG